MLFILIGLVVGVALAFGRLPVLAETASTATDGLVALGSSGVDTLLATFGANLDTSLATVLRASAVTLMPGIVAGVMLGVARGSQLVRRIGALVILVAGGYVAVTQPAPYSIVAAAILVIVGLSVAFIVTNGVMVAVSAVSGLLAATQLRLFFDGDPNRFNDTATVLADIAGVGDPSWWRLALVAASAGLAGSVFWHAMHR